MAVIFKFKLGFCILAGIAIAGLESQKNIQPAYLSEVIQYRSLD